MNHIFVEAHTREEAMSQYILPNISQMNTNFVITDRDGYIYGQTKGFFEEHGYGIQVFNLMDPENSLHFNPFHSVVDGARLVRGYTRFHKVAIEGPEKKHEAQPVAVQIQDRLIQGDGGVAGLTAMVETILKSTDSRTGHSEQAVKHFEKYLLLALVLYVAEVYEKQERNLWKISELLESVETLDARMSELHNRNFASMAVRNYRNFQMGVEMVGKEHVVTSLRRRLRVIETDVLKELMLDSSIDFDAFGQERQVLFVIAPEGAELVVAMIVQQLEERLREYTERICNSYRLPVSVTMLLSIDYASLISDLNMRMATSRKYNIGYSLISYISNEYMQGTKNEWEFLVNSCDNVLRLGSGD